MNNVREAPLVDGRPVGAGARTLPIARPARDGCALLLGRIGLWLAVIAFGGVAWAINGGYSVIGLGVIAAAFNDAGRTFWELATTIQFVVPVRGGVRLPLVPWIGVVASSLLQISVIWLKLSGRPIPRWLLAAAAAASIYDYGTTLFGLGAVAWIARIGIGAQALLAAPLTFALELMVGYALRGGKR